MLWRAVSGVVLGLWLSLLVIEICEELGFFAYDDPGLAQSMDRIVDLFGDGINPDGHQHPLETFFHPFSFAVADLDGPKSIFFHFLLKEPALNKPSRKIFKLHSVFLI